MSTPGEETPENGNQRRKSIGSGGGGSNLAGGKTRRYSIGITSSRKSIGDEDNIVPNYLRASTGSCHDFCKFGKKHEHSKSAIPIKFKRTAIVNKEKITQTVVPLEKKKTTLKPSTNPEIQMPVEPIKVTKKDFLLPSKKPQVLNKSSSINGKATKNELKTFQRSTSLVKSSSVTVNHDASSEGSNGGIKKKDVKTVKKTGSTHITGPVKKFVPKITPNKSQSPKASFIRAANLKVKQVLPLKDQNGMQKTEPRQTIDDKVQSKSVNDLEAESVVKPETIEFDLIQPSLELVNNPVCDNSDKNVVEEESTIVHPVFESSELYPDEQVVEEALIIESSQSSSDKDVLEEESLIPQPVSESSESYYDEEVLEDEFEYTDDEENVEDEESDNEKVSESANNDEMGTSVGNHSRKGRMVISEDKDDKAVKLRFKRGKILDLQSENNGPRRLKFRRRIIKGNEDGQSITRRTYKNKTLDLQTEINGPRRLKFINGKVMEDNEDKQCVSRRSFEKKYVEETKNINNGHESVVLKHQGDQGKKDAQGLFNNVIEETASKLVESRKSKVKALVGAFETVISLQDGKPSST